MALLQCSGWWEQEGYGRQAMYDLLLSFSDGRMTGMGSDIVGEFQISGYLDEDRIYLLKQYIGQHEIEYHGVSIGEGGYSGEWSCYGNVGGKWSIVVRRQIGGTTEMPFSNSE